MVYCTYLLHSVVVCFRLFTDINYGQCCSCKIFCLLQLTKYAVISNGTLSTELMFSTRMIQMVDLTHCFACLRSGWREFLSILADFNPLFLFPFHCSFIYKTPNLILLITCLEKYLYLCFFLNFFLFLYLTSHEYSTFKLIKCSERTVERSKCSTLIICPYYMEKSHVSIAFHVKPRKYYTSPCRLHF